MDIDPYHWLDALSRSHSHLTDLVGGLDDVTLEQPSYCDEWRIAEVLSHLGSGAEIFGEALDAVLEGEPAPDRGTYPAIWERWNAMSPREKATSCLAADGQFVETLARMGDRLATLHLVMFGSMEVDSVGFIGMRLGEHALHSWDIAVQLDSGATVAPEAVLLLVDRVAIAAGRLLHPEASSDTPFTARVETTDPVRVFDVEATDEPSMTDRTGTADVTEAMVDVHLPAEALLRLVYGRCDPAHSPRIDSEEFEAFERLRRVFPGG